VTYLLDSCAVIWSVSDTSHFTPSTLSTLEEADQLLASYPSLIEIAAKVSTGRLRFREPFETFLPRALMEFKISLLPLEASTIYRMSGLPPLHKDPFDRLLVAEALERDFTVVTPDAKFALYGVKVLW
jgi:PIN domain nuclease of toxin-antitoxin system